MICRREIAAASKIRKKPGGKSGEEVTSFKSVSNAVQDTPVAQAILQRAKEKGHGQELEL